MQHKLGGRDKAQVCHPERSAAQSKDLRLSFAQRHTEIRPGKAPLLKCPQSSREQNASRKPTGVLRTSV
jgi:hypothetical protein